MNKELIEKYKQYASTDEAHAVLFVKKYLRMSKGKWIYIFNYDGKLWEIKELEFRFVECELFDRKLKPKYPPKKDFKNDEEYLVACRAVTWWTAHEDMSQQRSQGIKGLSYQLKGVHFYVKNKNYDGYFKKDTPEKIKNLLKNPNDKTDPLWDIALNYKSSEDEYVYKYKLKWIKRVNK